LATVVKDGKWPKITQTQIAEIAPLKDGKPDLYNHLPTRFVTKEESEARGWTYFYIGDACRYGHKAPRFVSNPRMCVDCHRARESRAAIGGKAEGEYDKKALRPYSQPVRNHAVAATLTPLEPDTQEKRFLAQYAELRDFARAAQACGRTEGDFQARLSYSEVFRKAVHTLEADCGLQRTPTLLDTFDWTDDKRATLLRIYVDTGDIATARAAVQVSNYHFLKELEANPQFAAEYVEAEKLAERFVGEIGVSQAIKGDTRLLQRYLANVRPDQFGETSKVRVDLNVTEKLTDEQLNARFTQAIRQLGGRAREIVDAEFYELDAPAEVEAVGIDGNESSAGQPQSNLDLV
jgi:hypothetical protein